MNLWALSAAATAGYLAVKYGPKLISAANVGSAMRVSFDRVDGISFYGGLTNPRMKLKLYMSVMNPTVSQAKIGLVDLMLKDESGRPWAEIMQTENQDISRRSKVTLPLSVDVKLTNLMLSTLLPAVFSLFKKSDATAFDKLRDSLPEKLSIEGNVVVNGIRIPVTQTIPVRKPSNPSPGERLDK